MVEQYLEAKFVRLNCASQTESACKQALSLALSSVPSAIRAKLHKPKRRKPLRKKSPPPAVARTLKDKSSREQESQQFAKETEQTRNFTSKLRREQEDRTKREEQRREYRQMAQEKEQQQIQDAFREEQLKKEEEMKAHLLQKRQQRLKEQEKIRELIQEGRKKHKEIMKNTQLYAKMEEEFNRHRHLSETKEKNKSVTLEEIRLHAHKHDQLVRKDKNILVDQNKDFVNSLHKSQYLSIIREEEKQKIMAEKAVISMKQRLIDRKKVYSEIIKKMFPPVPDLLKQEEIKYRVNKFKTSIKEQLRSTKNFTPTVRSERPTHAPKKQSSSSSTKKIEAVKSTPLKKINYLIDLRKNNVIGKPPPKIDWERIANSDMDREERILKLRKIADKIENRALMEEGKIGGVVIDNPATIETSDKVSKLLIDSIKAKLAVFEN